MKLRLTGGSFANYTGQMGVVYFENGLSVHDVHPNDAIRIAGSIGAEWENGSPANVGDIYTQNMNTPAPSVEQMGGMESLLAVVGVPNADVAMKHSESVAHAKFEEEAPKAQPEPAAERVIYTAESLAELADEKGIVGLREVAKTFGVTGNSIALLIERILEKQG